MKYKDQGMGIVLVFSSLETPTPSAASRVANDSLKAVRTLGKFHI